MNVSGVVVACRPEHLDGVVRARGALAWAEVQHRDPHGRLVVTVEAADADESMERLGQIQRLEHVLMAELAGYYVDDEP